MALMLPINDPSRPGSSVSEGFLYGGISNQYLKLFAGLPENAHLLGSGRE